MCQAYEDERNYLLQKDAADARKVLAKLQEDTRRLSRYPEAIALLRRCADPGSPFRLESEEIPAFLAAEPAERGEGGAG